MDVETGAMRSLLRKLSQLLADEYNLQKGVRRQVRFLQEVLESMYAFQRQIAEAPPEMVDEHDRTWAREMREDAYDIEDVIDTILVSVHACSEPTDVGRSRLVKRAMKKMGMLPSKAMARGDIAASIENVMKKLVKMHGRRNRYGFVEEPVAATSSTVDPRLPALYRNERELVGIEGPMEELVRLLDIPDDKKREVKVVSIVGLGGVGKTTLAKAVYNRLQAQFDCRAVVTVSRNPDLRKVLKDILLDIDEAKYHTVITTKRDMDERQFIDEIRLFLETKRYLIVIDDIWDVRVWETISLALCYAGNGSRIITTSRKSDVAAKGRGATPYRLNPLSHANSEKLFYKRILGGEGNCPDTKLAEVSDKILKECSGLPLAIITVASVLASKPREEWSEVYNSIALRREGNRYVDNMRTVLSFSFYDLPFHLRACLLYLSIFPENWFIEKDFLIWKWVAEGFVHDERGMYSLFEIGESYFNELVNRSTIQTAEECLNKGHRVHGCRVHPVLLSQIRAISSEENFCTALEDEHHISPGNSNPRRIGMHSIRNMEHKIAVEANISTEKVRSFHASLCFIDGMPQLSSFQVLRVLALEYCPGMNSHHLKMIGTLVHLRYLGLVGAGVLELPETLGWLRFLQTLDLRETDIEQWPSTISNLQRLMCLCVHRTRAVAEGMVERLRSLEDLRLHLVSGDCSKLMAELGRLESLRVLVLGLEKIDVELEEALLDSLRKLPEIWRLEIYCNKLSRRAVAWEESRWVPPRRIRQLVVGGLLFSRLPSWINPSSLPFLSHLHLEFVIMEDGDLETLGTFPELRSLVLMAPASDEQEHHITTVVGSSDHAFNKLNFFSTNMVVRFESGIGGPPLPNLEHAELHVRVAQCADSWLSSLANLKSLEKVTVALDGRGASTAETEEAEEKLRRATSVHPNRRLRLEVTKQNGNEEVPLIEQFRFKDPRFEAMRSEMEKMQANRQVQVQPDNDSDEEITPAKVESE